MQITEAVAPKANTKTDEKNKLMGWIQVSHAIRRQASGLFSSYCHRNSAELRDQAAWKL